MSSIICRRMISRCFAGSCCFSSISTWSAANSLSSWIAARAESARAPRVYPFFTSFPASSRSRKYMSTSVLSFWMPSRTFTAPGVPRRRRPATPRSRVTSMGEARCRLSSGTSVLSSTAFSSAWNCGSFSIFGPPSCSAVSDFFSSGFSSPGFFSPSAASASAVSGFFSPSAALASAPSGLASPSATAGAGAGSGTLGGQRASFSHWALRMSTCASMRDPRYSSMTP